MKRLSIFSLLNLFIVLNVSAQALFPANKNSEGKSGFIDVKGKTVIPFIYDGVGEFSEGLAFVFVDGKGGFIDSKGKMIIEGEYESSEGFKSGVAEMKDKNYKTIFINKKGEQIPMDGLLYYARFSDGMMIAKIDGKYGYYDTKGILKIPAIYKWADGFNEGAAYVTREDNSKCFINTDGKVLFETDYWATSSFSEGLVQLSKYREYGYADKTGKFVISPEQLSQFETTYAPFSDGLAAFQQNKKFGFINKKGDIAIEAIYTQVGVFKNGFSKVAKTPQPKYVRYDWAYINAKGKIITDFKYRDVFPFSEGRAIGLWYNEEDQNYYYDLIDENGKLINSYMAYEGLEVKGFSNGLCLIYAMVNPSPELEAPVDSVLLSYIREWGGTKNTYINKSGEIVWQGAPYYVCFPPDAKVLLADGSEKVIAKLDGTETLLSWNQSNNKFTDAKITAIEEHAGSFDIIRIGFIPKHKQLTVSLLQTVENQIEYLEATPSHPIVGGNGPVRMVDLKAGELIYYSQNADEVPVACEIISTEKITNACTKVFNLKIDKSTYVVNGVLVMMK